MISMTGLTVQFGGVRPLDDLSAELAEPIVGLIGPNGAGKTTLLNVISGFVMPTAGKLEVDGRSYLALAPTKRVRLGLRRMFQTEQVVEDLTIFDNIVAIIDHVGSDDPVAEVGRAVAYLEIASLDRYGAELNLFERRLVELARTIVGRPKLIVMDEPAAGLTESETATFRHHLLGIPATFGAQVLLVDHDVDLIASTCSETLVLDFGRRLAVGPTRAVLADETVRRAYLGALS